MKVNENDMRLRWCLWALEIGTDYALLPQLYAQRYRS
jgi:hypothetical protein